MSEIRLVDFRGADAFRGLRCASGIPAENIGARRACLFWDDQNQPDLTIAGWHTKTGVTVRAFYTGAAA